MSWSEVCVAEAEKVRHPSLSVLMIRPCLRLLKTYPAIALHRLSELEALGNDARVPVTKAHCLLAEAIRLSGDSEIGLKAGRMISPEDGGALTYAILSASTIADAIGVSARYMRLLNDTVKFELERQGDLALFRIENHEEVPRAIAEYQASIVQTAYIQPLGTAAGLEWWFPFAAPADPQEYARTFGPSKLRFMAPCLGYSFDARFLAARLPTSDPALHKLMLRYAEMLLAQLPTTLEFTGQARAIIVNELAFGSPGIERVAARMSVSARTLRRRLDDEGTTFSDLVNDTRHRLALQYILKPNLCTTDVALLLGFADVATFYRAFKRWTGCTPHSYRAARGGAQKQTVDGGA